MKKLIFAIVMIMTLSVNASAQKDGFFGWNNNDENTDRYVDNGQSFLLPSAHGETTDQNAPLGSGLLVLGALGVGYAVIKRKKSFFLMVLLAAFANTEAQGIINEWGGTNGNFANPYIISDMSGLKLLATLSKSNSFDGSYFSIVNDIGTNDNPFDDVIGDNASCPFKGHIYGNNHTITVNLVKDTPYDNYDPEGGVAFIHYAGDIFIENLTIKGNISSANMYAAGFISYIKEGVSGGDVILINCRSSVDFSLTKSGDVTCGGFIGYADRTYDIDLQYCLFDGSFSSENGYNICGMVGYVDGYDNITFDDCIVVTDPSTILYPDGSNHTFCRHNISCTPLYKNNNYYHKAISAAEGTVTYSVDLAMGVGVEPRTQGIGVGNGAATIYSDGFTLGETEYFVGSIGENHVQITLVPTTEYVITSAKVSYSDITWSANPYGDGRYWFNMPAADVTITVILGVELIMDGYGDSGINDQWMFLAIPTVEDVAINSETGIVTVPTPDYDLYRFNQSADAEWENSKYHWNDDVNPFRYLKNGKGYLYARKDDATLVFPGTFRMDDTYDVALDYDANACLKGWNLVGNPFAKAARVDRPFYRMNSDGSDIEPVLNYETTDIPVCNGIIVCADGENETVRFSKLTQSRSTENGGITMTLTKTGTRGTEYQDKAIVSYNEGAKLGKFVFNENHAKLYIPQNDKDYAIACTDARPCVSKEMPVCFKTKETGKYTICFEGDDMNDVKLIDKFEKVTVDLGMESSYTFIGSAVDNVDRFVLVFGTSTSSTGSTTFAYQNGNEIVVDGEGELQVFDMTGRMVMTAYINGVETYHSTSLQTGVYILRLVGNEIRTQKIVVR